MIPQRGAAVYGAALNFRGTLEKLGPALYRDPYKNPPKAPVLYMKTANTWIANGAPIPCPAGVEKLRMGGTLAVVIGKTATRVEERNALEYVRGYTVANDVSIPHESYYRPAIKQQCRDGFCPMGPEVRNLPSPEDTEIRIFVNGELACVNSTRNLVRGVARLIADITEFLTLREGDVLLAGEPDNAPLAGVGDRVRVEIDGLGALENPVGHADNTAVSLAPANPGTIFALGLNYADHAKELSFKAPEEPLVFLKGPNTLCGDSCRTRRPAGVTYMHYECELAVVIGKIARKVKRADAYDYVRGYTVANDYAIRDYLENYYRPNFRVKSRDASTPLGPRFVDAADVPDAMNLRLRTMVNGKITQEGSTRDMIFTIPALIEYLSGFMTLGPGDLILTGTPEGLADVKAGDEVITEIEGIGRLKNTIYSDEN